MCLVASDIFRSAILCEFCIQKSGPSIALSWKSSSSESFAITSTGSSSEGAMSRFDKKSRTNAPAAVPVVGGMNVDGVHTGSCGCIRCAGLAVSLPQMGVLRANSVTLPWEIERFALAFLSLLDVAICFTYQKAAAAWWSASFLS